MLCVLHTKLQKTHSNPAGKEVPFNGFGSAAPQAGGTNTGPIVSLQNIRLIWKYDRISLQLLLKCVTLRTNVCLGCGCSPLSGLSSVPDPEWLPELDWLPADEGRASRPRSSSLPWVRSPPSELLRESLRAERDEEVLLVSLRGLLEFRPKRDRTGGRRVF